MYGSKISAFVSSAAALLLIFGATSFAGGQARTASEGGPSGGSPAIVIGFVGGFVGHNDLVHSEVQLAWHLHEAYTEGVYVQAFENRRREQAHQEILHLLDNNHDGALTATEKSRARIIIYGHSWGGSETVTLARELAADQIPVALTVQVDSVSKIGEDDRLIPANVAEAINFYQTKGFIRGEPEIRAADASRTHILGNIRMDYATHPVRCSQYPWYDRFLMKTHVEIECDAAVWGEIEEIIRAHLPDAPQADSSIGFAESN